MISLPDEPPSEKGQFPGSDRMQRILTSSNSFCNLNLRTIMLATSSGLSIRVTAAPSQGCVYAGRYQTRLRGLWVKFEP